MDQIRETLGNLSELDNEALEQLSSAIVTEFESKESEEVSAEVVANMTELADALDTVKTEMAARETQAQELSDMKEAALNRVRGKDEEKDADVDDEKAVEVLEEELEEVKDPSEDEDKEELAVEEVDTNKDFSADKPAEEKEKEEEEKDSNQESELSNQVETELSVQEPAPEEAPSAEFADDSAGADKTELTQGKDSETVTASVNAGSEDLQAPDTHRPNAEVQENARAAITITAGGDISGVSNGSTLDDMGAVAKAMADRIHAIRRTNGGDGEQFSVATLNLSYPENRTLSSGDTASNDRKIEDIASPQAVVAAGGFCAPLEVDYNIFGFGTTERPVRDSLASFGADRGGIRFTRGPRIGDLDAAVSVWTATDDASAGALDGTTTKPCLRVVCGTPVDVVVDAIPMCLTFGNLQSRAFPEQIEANNKLAVVTQARLAEQRILTRIGALSTQVTAASTLGAARDFFVQVDQAAAGYRSRNRLSPTESLRVIAPAWLRNMTRADLVMSIPGQQNDPFGLADNILNAWFAARNINVTWSIDGETGQIFGAQAAGALSEFPSTIIWYMFSEGTFVFLDGGTLDLGLVRDSGLNATNDYKMFVETFEAVAMRGVESLRVVSTVNVDGSSSGTVALNV